MPQCRTIGQVGTPAWESNSHVLGRGEDLQPKDISSHNHVIISVNVSTRVGGGGNKYNYYSLSPLLLLLLPTHWFAELLLQSCSIWWAKGRVKLTNGTGTRDRFRLFGSLSFIMKTLLPINVHLVTVRHPDEMRWDGESKWATDPWNGNSILMSQGEEEVALVRFMFQSNLLHAYTNYW